MNSNNNLTNPMLSTGQVYGFQGYFQIITPSNLGNSITINLYLGGISGTSIASAIIPISGSVSANTTYLCWFNGLYSILSSSAVQVTGHITFIGSTLPTIPLVSTNNSPINGLNLSINQQISFTQSQNISVGLPSLIILFPGAYLFPLI